MPDTADPKGTQPSIASRWEIVERISKTLSIAAIPIVLAAGGWVIQTRLQEQTVRRDYVQLAVTILKEPADKGNKDMRAWAADLLASTSPVKFDQSTVDHLKAGTVKLPETFNVETAAAAPAVSSSASHTDEAENWELKGFSFLFERDVDSALQAFKSAENIYASFHSVSEIRKLLEDKRGELAAAPREGRNDVWKNFYIKLRGYTWHVAPDVRRKLEEVISSS
jgi:hypothetical protein